MTKNILNSINLKSLNILYSENLLNKVRFYSSDSTSLTNTDQNRLALNLYNINQSTSPGNIININDKQVAKCNDIQENLSRLKWFSNENDMDCILEDSKLLRDGNKLEIGIITDSSDLKS